LPSFFMKDSKQRKSLNNQVASYFLTVVDIFELVLLIEASVQDLFRRRSSRLDMVLHIARIKLYLSLHETRFGVDDLGF